MKCVVLGGTGFIGSHLTEALLAHGHAVRVFDRPKAAWPGEFSHQSAVEKVEGDFLNPDDLACAISGYEVVFHLVSTTLPGTSNLDPHHDIETNVLGSLRLFEQARHLGVRKVIFVSSGGTVYGLPECIPVPESHPTNPVTSHGIGKLTIEKYLELYRFLYGLEYCVLRLANPYGERQRPNAPQGAVAVFLQKALHDNVISVWGDGTIVRDFIYVGDAVAAIGKALHHSGQERIFNVGSGIGISINDVFAEMERVLERPVRRQYLPSRKFDVRVNVLDTQRIRAAFDWQPTVAFGAGIRRTLAWMRRNSL